VSAVFLLAIAAVPHYVGGVPVPRPGAVPLSEQAALVRRVAEQRLAAIEDDALREMLAGFVDDEPGDPRAVARQAVSAFLDRAIATDDLAVPRFYESECDERDIGGVPYVLCGEQSWGDRPEGNWEIIAIVGSLGLFDEPVPSQAWQLDCAHDDEDLVLTEDGYTRTWSTRIERDASVIEATHTGSDNWTEEGDGQQYLECVECGAHLPVPEGFEIIWD
jgi:hypothetical protein